MTAKELLVILYMHKDDPEFMESPVIIKGAESTVVAIGNHLYSVYKEK